MTVPEQDNGNNAAQMASESQSVRNRRLMTKLLITAVVMFLFALFVLPPMYTVFCELTGLNGKPSATPSQQWQGGVEQNRTVRIELLSKVDAAMPWDFTPAVSHIDVHPGEVVKTSFHVRNRSPETIVGRAVASITPAVATAQIKKTECFCFREQQLKGLQEMDMPLIFYVDPALDKNINTITLSYTLFRQAAAQQALIQQTTIQQTTLQP